MSQSRAAIAVLLGVALCVVAVAPFALAIKRFDWGVSLVLAAPLLVWLLLRAGRALERWARNEDRTPPDPDFPDEEP